MGREGGGRQVDYQIGLLPAIFLHRGGFVEVFASEIIGHLLVEPQVFADGHGYPEAIQFNQIELFVGFEMAVFIKNIVGRQQCFVVNAFYHTVLHKKSRIEEHLSLRARVDARSANQGSNTLTAGGNLFNGSQSLCDKLQAFQQVVGIVSANRQLREYHQVCTLLFCSFNGRNDAGTVFGKVSNVEIQLCQGYPHLSICLMTTVN